MNLNLLRTIKDLAQGEFDWVEHFRPLAEFVTWELIRWPLPNNPGLTMILKNGNHFLACGPHEGVGCTLCVHSGGCSKVLVPIKHYQPLCFQ